MFNEQEEEYSSKQNKKIPVWQSQKYIQAKKRAKELEKILGKKLI